MQFYNRRMFLGERICRVWAELRNEKENVIYADFEYINLLNLEELFSNLLILELDVRLTAKQYDSSVKNIVTLNHLDGGGIYWHGCDRKLIFSKIETKTGNKYCDAILALERHKGSVILSPTSLLKAVLSDEVRLCSDIQLFYGMIRPLVMERDSHSKLPKKRSGTERPDECPISGWLSWAVLEAAKSSLFPIEILCASLMQKQKEGRSEKIDSILSLLYNILQRFQQMLTCRNEIDWSYFEIGDIHYRFDHLLLLGTAMLDQLATLISKMANNQSYGMEISLNPQRGKKSKRDFMRLAIDNMTLEGKNELEESYSIAFRSFLYSFRNIVAHRKPSRETVRYSCSSDRPEGILFPLSNQLLSDNALVLLETRKGLTGHAIIGNKDIAIDPLVMSWFITNEVARITRIILNDCMKRLNLSVHPSPPDGQEDFSRLFYRSISPVMGTWDGPSMKI